MDCSSFLQPELFTLACASLERFVPQHGEPRNALARWKVARADHQPFPCLVREDVVVFPSQATRAAESSAETCSPGDDDSALSVDVVEDPSALSAVPPTDGSVCRRIVSIVYNPSYQVPTLYFSYEEHSSGCRLDSDPVWLRSKLPPAMRPHSEEALRRLLSPLPHPVFGIPMQHVHPCDTAELLATVQGDADTRDEHSAGDPPAGGKPTSADRLLVQQCLGREACVVLEKESPTSVYATAWILRWIGLVGPLAGIWLDPTHLHSTGTAGR